jgi:purine nucleosidase
LTNLAVALERDPAALARYRSVVVMGGAGVERPSGAPDPTLGVGDPNTGHDPVATARVAAARDQSLVGVDITMHVRLTPDDLGRVDRASTPWGQFLARVLPFYVRFHEARFGPRTCCAHDALAAAALTDPDLVTRWISGRISVVGEAADARAVLAPDERRRSRVVADLQGREIIDRLLTAVG